MSEISTVSSIDSDSRTCFVCNRQALKARYCVHHERAYSEVSNAYEKWQKAFENLTWERYLERILELKETGEWAKQVARHQLSATGSLPVSK